jgi:antitoxin FitA
MSHVTVNMHLRDMPDDVHAALVERASNTGKTLRQYVLDVLASHTEVPTMDDWLDRVARRRAMALKVDVVAALQDSRNEDDRLVG